MYRYSELKTVHLEVSSKCNAACPMCLRNICGGALNPQLPLTELLLQDIKHIFPVSFIKQLDRIYMCGNYGDPIAAKDTLKIFQFFRSAKASLNLSMFTNGSGKSLAWWKKLAQVINTVHFSIDGLEDTNAIYRRGTQFKKIMNSAESYISAGGRAVWDYIVFRHNEHQVERAQELARQMGFSRFVVKKTGRFFSNQKLQTKTRQVILNKTGEVEAYLESPINPKYQNQSLKKEKELSEKYGNLYEYLNQTEVKCRVSREKSIYISAEAFVFPCCWTANQLYPWYFKKRTSQIWKLIDQLPEKEYSLSAKKHSIEKILKGDLFQKLIPNSWAGKDVQRDKLKVCAKTCGQSFTPFVDQFAG